MDVKVPPEDIEGYMLQLDGNVVVDLGDDAYTQGKPHPMIDLQNESSVCRKQ